jgi:hypothetical protein
VYEFDLEYQEAHSRALAKCNERLPFHFIRSRGTDDEAERTVRGQLDMEVALSPRRAESQNGSAKFTGIRALANVGMQHVKKNHCGALPKSV